MKIVFASGNSGKLREASEIFKGFEIISIKSYQDWIPPEENGSTFLQNSVVKAEAASRVVRDLPVLADDSGLVVPALGGAPGIMSARFSAEGTDEANRAKLLAMLKGVRDRSAYFACSAVMIFPDGSVIAERGVCPGRIIDEQRGGNGFGYDPVFVPDGFSETLAELPEEVKNSLSHRGTAFGKLISKISRSN
ncbi:RdgB/HAM1 family non-canonical purine NTP pyrophosphatase [bacterium]|nr:RdgB/HAM1 family non-canonical purine NTP pyrophosphatase [bacterium]